MSDRQVFYRLYCTGDACDLTHAARDEAARTWKCKCGSPKPGVSAVDVHLEHLSARHGPLSFVFEGVGIARRSFLEQLGEDVIERDLYMGKVFNAKGRMLEDWCTFHGRRKVVVRGTDEEDCDAGYRCCGKCGRNIYFALGQQYLYPSPPTDATIYDGDNCLVVSGHLLSKLTIPRKAKIHVERLEVVDEPLDGLGVIEPREPDRSKWGDKHRSMRGRTSLTDFVQRKIDSDDKARSMGYYRRIFYHFFPDAKSGRIEIAPDVLQAMNRNGIEYVLHE